MLRLSRRPAVEARRIRFCPIDGRRVLWRRRERLGPLLEKDDDFLAHLLHGDIDETTGLLADPTPPYMLYPADLNWIGPLGNPFLSGWSRS